jgi:hypothetical protein
MELVSVLKTVPNALEFVDHDQDIRENNRAKKCPISRSSITSHEFLRNRANEIAVVSTEHKIPSDVLSFVDIIIPILAYDPGQERTESVHDHHILFP